MTGTNGTREAEIADLGIRALAAIVDIVFVILLSIAIAIAIGGRSDHPADFSLRIFVNVIGLAVFCLYYFASEAIWSATPAKLLIGLRVVGEEDGQPIDWVMSMLRNLLRPIDWIPTLYFVGFLFAVNSPRKQRLGDRLARTVVIRV